MARRGKQMELELEQEEEASVTVPENLDPYPPCARPGENDWSDEGARSLAMLRLRAAYARKMQRVMETAGYVQKTGKNKHFKYSFVEATEVYAKLRAALSEAGLAVCATKSDVRRLVLKDGMYLAVVHDAVQIVDIETGYAQWFEGSGSGADSQDKAVMKGSTAARKVTVLHAILASSGDDPEADEATDAPRRRRGKKGVARPAEDEAATDTDAEEPVTPATKGKKKTKKQQLADDLAALGARVAAATSKEELRAIKDTMLDYSGKEGFAELRRAFMDKAEELGA